MSNHRQNSYGSFTGLRAIRRILGARDLPLSAKWTLLRRAMLASPSSDVLAIPFGAGSVFLDPQESADWAVFSSIFLKRGYYTSFRDAVVLDLGAHKGLFLSYALMKRARAVIAYEPDPTNYSYLEQCAQSFNAAGRVAVIHQCAINAEAGEETLYVADRSWGHSLIAKPDKPAISERRVKVVAFEEALVAAHDLADRRSRVIVKMDIEGAECDTILRTRLHSLLQIDEMFVEHHTTCKCSCDELLRRLEMAGLYPQSDVEQTPGKQTVFHVSRKGNRS